mmetsp:Transcript_16438/g.57444  ORF Transcript_16438/g.57444 Transcript_16438/m.57444 type:complete len:701 (-) Transcript_16438:194-2296(-)
MARRARKKESFSLQVSVRVKPGGVDEKAVARKREELYAADPAVAAAAAKAARAAESMRLVAPHTWRTGVVSLGSDDRHVAKKHGPFHSVIDPEMTQVAAYDAVDLDDLIDAALSGHDCTLFAYGQTGSGKTHTLFGPPGCTTEASLREVGEGTAPADWGMFPRAAVRLLAALGLSGGPESALGGAGGAGDDAARTTYAVEWGWPTIGGWEAAAEGLNGPLYTKADLEPATNYVFRVVARNVSGEATSATSVTMTTLTLEEQAAADKADAARIAESEEHFKQRAEAERQAKLERENAALKAQLAAGRKEIARVESARKQEAEARAAAEASLSRIAAERDDQLSEARRRAEEAVAEAKGKEDDAAAAAAALLAKVEAAEAARDVAKAEAERRAAEAADARERAAAFQREKDAEAAALRAELEAASGAAASTEAERAARDAQVAALEERLSAVTDEATRGNKAASEAAAAAVAAEQAAADEARRAMEDMATQLSLLTAGRDEAHELVDRTLAENESQREQIRLLQEQLAAAAAKEAEARAEAAGADALMAAMAEMEARNESLAAALRQEATRAAALQGPGPDAKLEAEMVELGHSRENVRFYLNVLDLAGSKTRLRRLLELHHDILRAGYDDDTTRTAIGLYPDDDKARREHLEATGKAADIVGKLGVGEGEGGDEGGDEGGVGGAGTGSGGAAEGGASESKE